MNIVIASGGFDNLHPGHVRYLQSARLLGDMLVVGINSDRWLIRKKGNFFMPWDDRRAIVLALKCVDQVISWDDSDNSACELIKDVMVWDSNAHYVFCNGGDRHRDNIPEINDPELRDLPNLEFRFGVGGENKVASSSDYLKRWLEWAR